MKTPTCTRCNYQFTENDLWDKKGKIKVGDGEESYVVCPECDKNLKIICYHVLEFQVENEDET